MTGVDDSKREYWQKAQEARDRTEQTEANMPPLKGGRGGGTSDGMHERVAKLEAFMEVVREDSREIRADLKAIIGKLGTMPSKSDLDTWRWQWLATGITIVALTVGGITGGLALIAHFTSP